MMDIQAIITKLNKFVRQHRTQFEKISNRESQFLELAALVATAEHYKAKGYIILPHNLRGGYFTVKTSARGYPWNFSWFEAKKGYLVFEIHGNTPVLSSYGLDNGVYVVDVAVVRGGWYQSKIDKKKWKGIQNSELITFIEVKKLVIYPMLLAQFLGIVHEIKPQFLDRRRPQSFLKDGHFDPALISVGYMTAVSNSIRKGFIDRNYKLTILPNFDVEFAMQRSGRNQESLFDKVKSIKLS